MRVLLFAAFCLKRPDHRLTTLRFSCALRNAGVLRAKA